MDQPAILRDPKSIDVLPTFLAGVKTVGRNFLPFTAAYLPVGIPLVVFLVVGCPTILHFMTTARTGVAAEAMPDIPTSEWIALAGTILYSLAVGTWTWAAVNRMADAVLAGEPCPRVPAAYAGSLERVPALIGTYFCMIALSIVGTLLCILPGIYVGIALAIAAPRAATRSHGPIEVIQDSFALTRGRWWRVCGFLLLVGLSIQVIYLPLSLLGEFIGMAATESVIAWYLPLLLALSLFLGMFQVVCTVALHRRLEALGPLPRPNRVTPPPIDDTPAPEAF